jgi:hypothetical protein
MIPLRRCYGLTGTATLLALALGACATPGPSTAPSEPAPPPEIPSRISAEEIVGRWGLAAYHKDADRPRTEAAARSQCSNPYVISRGSAGGVIMHLADKSQPEELRMKGGPGGKSYIGPSGQGGMPEDREIISFDGRVMVTRFIDPDAGTRYGSMVFVRCGAEGTAPRTAGRARPSGAPPAQR